MPILVGVVCAALLAGAPDTLSAQEAPGGEAVFGIRTRPLWSALARDSSAALPSPVTRGIPPLHSARGAPECPMPVATPGAAGSRMPVLAPRGPFAARPMAGAWCTNPLFRGAPPSP